MMSVSIDEKTISFRDPKTGRESSYPALHPRWKDDVQFVLYRSPPKDPCLQSADYLEWLERLTFIEEDLLWLLQLPHQKFWCQVIFDESLQRCIESYLRNTPRTFDGFYRLPESARDKQLNVHRRVFMVCLRISTYKESKDDHITPSVFGEILYENFLFDIPKIMDLCVLYHRGNISLLQKMVANIFNQQPKYEDDLRSSVPTVLQVFDCIADQCGIYFGGALGSPKKLAPTKPAKTHDQIKDVVNYLSDTCETLYAFLEVYPKAAIVLHEQHLELNLAAFYENVPPKVKEMLKDRECENPGDILDLKKKIHRNKKLILKIVNKILFTSCLQPILDKSDKASEEIMVEDYLQAWVSMLGERRFIADYECAFPLENDLDILGHTSYSIDETRIEFLQEAIIDACFSCGKIRKSKTKAGVISNPRGASDQDHSPKDVELDEKPVGDLSDDKEADFEELGACAMDVTGVQLDSLIYAVKDLLPDLGEGFLQLCLQEFNYSVENTINALLEDRLPPSLQDVDRNMARPEPADKPVTLLETRRNVFDNDEFDVFSRDQIDASKIHKGKKQMSDDISSFDDKKDLQNFREVYSMYGNMYVDSMYDHNNLDYDDEYDDTYDSHEVGADDADSADELTYKKQFVVQPLNQAMDVGNSDEEEDDEESAPNPPERKRDQFVEDPAKIRERQAQRWANRRGGPRRHYDVKGRGRGQGQETEVTHNRLHKDKNKARVGNHNRRVLADRKRMKGMGPLA